MDPVTHALVGLGLAGFSGAAFSMANPLYLGACLGAMAPDLDIVYQFKGDVTYLKHHRGFSHSIPGMLILSLGIAALLSLFDSAYSFWSIFIWTTLGTFSHGLMDLLNSYGAKVFWPFSSKRWTLNLINAVDPIVILILTGMVLAQKSGFTPVLGFSLLFCYLLTRFLVAWRLRKILAESFKAVSKVTVMPSMLKFWCWDCLVETTEQVFFVEMNSFTSTIKIQKKLSKEQITNALIAKALESKLGQIFREFTPHFHVILRPWKQGYLVKFLDLRYCLKQEFLHSATILFNQKQEIAEQVFHPYHKNRNIKITG